MKRSSSEDQLQLVSADGGYQNILDNPYEIDADDDITNPRNFLTSMYKNDEFIRMKEIMSEDILNNAKKEQEAKNLIEDMDQYLKNLKGWKQKRDHE